MQLLLLQAGPLPLSRRCSLPIGWTWPQSALRLDNGLDCLSRILPLFLAELLPQAQPIHTPLQTHLQRLRLAAIWAPAVECTCSSRHPQQPTNRMEPTKMPFRLHACAEGQGCKSG